MPMGIAVWEAELPDEGWVPLGDAVKEVEDVDVEQAARPEARITKKIDCRLKGFNMTQI
jgi:hypothetical protein